MLAPAERIGSAEQSALMLREVPRVRADACETGDWSHVDVYLSKAPGLGLLLLRGSAWEGEVMEWAAKRALPRRHGRRAAPGRRPRRARARGRATPSSAALVEGRVAELLAAELYARHGDRLFDVNLPNWLSVGRILLIPVFMVALLGRLPQGDLVAVAVFTVAALTDKLDGYLARSRNATTTFGVFLDPLADKLLVSAALISLVELNRLAALGGDGHHRARVRRLGPADGRRQPARRDRRLAVGEGQDDGAGRGDRRPDRRPPAPRW